MRLCIPVTHLLIMFIRPERPRRSSVNDAEVDAAYVALPNSEHRRATEALARLGIHVLCEKPMATSSSHCEAMIRATKAAGVKLMVAYRLHFEKANLAAIEHLRKGSIGEP